MSGNSTRAETAARAIARKASQQHPRADGARVSFLEPTEFTPSVLNDLVRDGLAIKTGDLDVSRVLQGRRIALLFQKTSTRTRCSFEVGIWDMGGQASVIDWNSSNFVLSDLEDEIQVIARYYDLIVARMRNHADIVTMAKFAGVPVINGLSDRHHPCQALSDYLTMQEYFGSLPGLRIGYVGDGNNVCASLMEAAPAFGVKLTVATPEAFRPSQDLLNRTQSNVQWTANPVAAVAEADVIYTDTWVSMGMEAEREERLKFFSGFQVNAQLLARAPEHALIMHCLPAHPGEEISSEVLRGPRSIVLDQAENRKHGQMALLKYLLRPAASK